MAGGFKRKSSMLMCVNCGLPATSPIAHPPGAVVWQSLVDLDVSPVSDFNAGQFQAESFGVPIAACGVPSRHIAAWALFLQARRLA
jgi:hypothetical protein